MELEDILGRVETRLQALGLSAHAASLAARKPDAIRNLKRAVKNGDRRGITTETLAALAPVLKTSASWLLEGASASWLLEGVGDPNAGTEVKVAGRIGAGAEILPEYEQIPEDGLFEISVPFATPADTIAFEVEGDSMWPRYDSGDVVICWRQSEDAENVVGREAAVRTRDGRRYLKRVRRGAVAGTYDLESHNAAPIRGVEIVWAAAIQAVVRAGQWQRIASSARSGM
ncbi:peptidase S24 [Methylovirgula ligni]|uniref:Phage repressor protein C with HTH and peptisase S24 domain n=1 Tax=Methylovirgula ligni TaxID=569860 RepID=A0A3D9YXM1_9HYPH|nr:S24 family peptidase [Methylovirgula ligni]QAY95901.1 peptidase S24 [Methylovirgula ligni]REF86441.1 phage repressor protein C with HTH and peptisase S24 domain [Methylovirgula ligni]